MNRILKFRMPIFKNDETVDWHYWGFCGELEGEFISPLSNYRHSPSFQFTGLCDKNGLEIYEGSILDIFDEDYGNKIGVVRFEPDYGAFIVERDWDSNQHHVILNCDVAYFSKIIGNCYNEKII